MPDEMNTGSPASADPPLHCLACRATMGQADVCPACGWSYRSDPDAPPDPDLDPSPSTAPDDEPAPAPVLPPSLGPPVMSRGAVWAEVGAVLAVGVMPFLLGALSITINTAPPLPYWLDAVHRTGLDCCTIFVTLYLIYRSGEAWARFGLTRPRPSDVLLGLGLFVVAEALWVLCFSRLPTDRASPAVPATALAHRLPVDGVHVLGGRLRRRVGYPRLLGYSTRTVATIQRRCGHTVRGSIRRLPRIPG